MAVSAIAGVVTVVAVATLLVLIRGDGDDEVAQRGEALQETEAGDVDGGADAGSDADAGSSSTPVSSPPSPEPSPDVEPTLPRVDPGWVGIIRSLAVDRVPYTRAQNEARDLTARGITAEVLFSSNYRTMNGGYWVVYSGVFSTRDAASAYCVSIQPQLSNTCYPREANGYQPVPPPF